MRMIKHTICIVVSILLCLDMLAQSDLSSLNSQSRESARELDDIPELRNKLDDMFKSLDKRKIPTGLLLDYAVELTDITAYDGVIRDDNFMNAKTFEYILRTIRSSAVSAKPFQEVSFITSSMNLSRTDSSIPVSIAAFRYNQIAPNALSDSLITYIDSEQIVKDRFGSLDDTFTASDDKSIVEEDEKSKIDSQTARHNPGSPESFVKKWINPYTERIVFAASPCENIVRTPYVNYSFSSNWVFSNLDILSIEFDAGIGQGYQPINLSGDSFFVYYGGQGGLFETKTKVTLSDGTVLQSHSAIYVLVYDPTPVPTMAIDETLYFESRVTAQNHTPKATVSIKYSRTNLLNVLENPLIVAEGFDPFSHILSSPSGSTSIDDLSNSYLRNIYDIVYIDWNDSCAPIELNADILIQVIQWVNNHKSSGNSNVVLGYSMGGLVARYALCKMEEEGISHDTSAYISYDSPHLGAHVPLGYMYLARDVFNTTHLDAYLNELPDIFGVAVYAYFVYSLLTDKDLRNNYKEITALANAPSVQQMLYYYVNREGVLDNHVHQEWQRTLASMGFPSGTASLPLNRIAISNGGSVVPSPQYYFSLNANLQANEGVVALANLIGTALSFSFKNLLMLILPHRVTYEFQAGVSPCVFTNQEIYSAKITVKKRFLWIFNVETVPFEKHVYNPLEEYPIEMATSSYYDLPMSTSSTPTYWEVEEKNDSSCVDYRYKISAYTRFGFIPTASSLCYGSAFAPNPSQYHADFQDKPLDKLKQTPFHTYYVDAQSTRHISDINQAYYWMKKAIDFKIIGPNTIVTGDSLSVSPSYYYGGQWSTSNSEVATVDIDGKVSVYRRGTVKVSYSGVDPGGHPFFFTRTFLAGGMPKFKLTSYGVPYTVPNPPYREFWITANYVGDSGVGLTPTKYLWADNETDGLSMPINGPAPSINWVEERGFTHSVKVPLQETRYVLFKAYFGDIVSPIAVIRCDNPKHFDENVYVLINGELVPVPIHHFETIEDDSMSSSFENLERERTGYTYRFEEQEIEFSSRPDNTTILSAFMQNESFVRKVKELKPWGEKFFVAIPFQVTDNTTGEVFDAYYKLYYRENE